jgi:DNA processing protein
VCAKAGLSDLTALCGQAFYIGATDYPELLTVAEDAPPVLMPFGDGSLLNRHTIAIVSTQNVSANGRTLTAAFAEELSGAEHAIAHIRALHSGTIAAEGGGFNVIYPRYNSELYHRILDGRLVVSEMPRRTNPQGWYFPHRNRITSGLSLGVVVVEAAERSSSLTTARFTAEQSLYVLAVPGSPLDPRTHGIGRLVHYSATLVMSTNHISRRFSASSQLDYRHLSISSMTRSQSRISTSLNQQFTPWSLS